MQREILTRALHIILVATFVIGVPSSGFAQPKLVRALDLGNSASGWAGVSDLRYSADGKWIASTHGLSGRQTVTRWRASDGRQTANGTFGMLAVVHPDCNTVAHYGVNGVIRLGDLTKRKVVGTLNPQGPGVDACISPDGKLLAASGIAGEITLWDLATRKTTFAFSHPTQVASMQFSTDSKTLVSISHSASLKLETLKVWEVSSGKELASLQLVPSSVERAKELQFLFSISNDGKLLALGLPAPQTGTATFFELPSLKEIANVKNVYPASIRLSPNVKTAAIISLSVPPRPEAPYTIQLIDIENRRPLNIHLKQNEKPATLLTGFSPDSRMIAFMCVDGNMRLWDVTNGNLKATLAGPLESGFAMPAAFSPDGKSIAVGTGKSITIWDISGL